MVHISLVLSQVIYAIVAACTGVHHTGFHSLSLALSIETDDLRQWRLELTEKLCKQKLLKG